MINHGAPKGFAGFFAAESIPRRMTARAIADRLSQIGSAIPFGALCRIDPIPSTPEEQNLPTFLERPDAERKRNLVRRSRSPHRRPRHQIGGHRLALVLACFCLPPVL